MEAEPLFSLPLERLLLLVSEMKVVLLLTKFVLYLSNAAKLPFERKIFEIASAFTNIHYLFFCNIYITIRYPDVQV
jgi:hypothetical protein